MTSEKYEEMKKEIAKHEEKMKAKTSLKVLSEEIVNKGVKNIQIVFGQSGKNNMGDEWVPEMYTKELGDIIKVFCEKKIKEMEA